MLGLEVVSGNDTAFTHSDFRRGSKLVMTMMPGTDIICSGFGGIPNFDNVFAGSNEECDDYDDVYRLQRDMRVDGGITPITEEKAIEVRSRAAKAMQSIFEYLELPEITDEEVDAATYGYSSKDMPPRNKAEDMKAIAGMMEKGTTVVDLIKGLCKYGFEDIAENILGMLKRRIAGDYLHASAIFDSEFHIKSGLNDGNDYMGPGTGYRLEGERWDELKWNPKALKTEKIAKETANKGAGCIEELGPARKSDDVKEVVIAVSPAFGTGIQKNIREIELEKILQEIMAGIEEEGMNSRLIKVLDSTDLAVIAHEGAALSGSGICIGLQSRGTIVIHHKDQVPLDNLELFPQCPLYDLKVYRNIGKNAARYAKGILPEPLDVLNDYMVPTKYLAKSMLLHLNEVENVSEQKPVDLKLEESQEER